MEKLTQAFKKTSQILFFFLQNWPIMLVMLTYHCTLHQTNGQFTDQSYLHAFVGIRNTELFEFTNYCFKTSAAGTFRMLLLKHGIL